MKSLMRMLIGMAILLVASVSVAQLLNDGSATGLPPFVGMNGGKLDVVSLQNGNLHIEIPLATLRNKRGRTTAYRYVYDIPTWVLTRYPGDGFTPTYWVVDRSDGWGQSEDFRMVGDSEPNYVNWADSTITCPQTGPAGTTYHEVQVRSGFTVGETDGTKHPLALRTESQTFQYPCVGQQLTSHSLDGTGVFVDISSSPYNPSIWLKDGTQTAPSWHDTNGNLGVVMNSAPTTERAYLSSGLPYDLVHFKNSNGNAETFRIDYEEHDYQQTNVCPLRQQAAQSETCYEDTTPPGLVPSILTLPNGLTYVFHWAVSSYGLLNLTSVDLPSGGHIAYTYSAKGFLSDNWRTTPTNARSTVISRTVTGNGSSAQWTYSGYGSGLTVVTRPDSVVENHTYSTLNGLHGTSVETQVQIVQNGSTLHTVSTDYNFDVEPETGHAVGARPIRDTVTLENGLVTKTETDYEVLTGSYPSGSYTYSRLNPSEKREYAYGSGTAGSLLRRTTLSYLHSSNSTYLNLHITDRLASRYVYDGSGNQKAASQNLYDVTTVWQASGAVAHDYTNFGTSFTYRGNPSSVQVWRNTDNAWLSTDNWFDELGNLRQTRDPGQHVTGYNYGDFWGNSTCAPSGGNAQIWATAAVNHLNQVIQQARNSCTSTLATAIEANNQSTTYTYDSVDRLSQINYPDQGQKTYTYVDTSSSLSITETQLQGTTTTTRFDDLGRVTQTDSSDPEGDVHVHTNYDDMGRVYTVSNPYRSTSDPTYGAITYLYDAFGRIMTVIDPDDAQNTPQRVQTTYSGNCSTVTDETGRNRKSCSDALGRLTNVWEDPAGLNYETAYQYDTLGNLTRVDQKGDSPGNSANWRTRTFTYDSLSRLLTANNPESGIVTYTYTPDATCNPGGESLRTKTDQRGITTTYCYEGLHRVSRKDYTGEESPGTPSAYFDYDSAPGWSLDNAIGRLVRTRFASGINTEIFSYKPLGQVKQVYTNRQSNAFNGWYEIKADYTVAGQMYALTYPSGRKVIFNYNLAGRMDGVVFDSFNGQHVGYQYWWSPTGSPTDPGTWGYHPNGALRRAIVSPDANSVTDVTAYNPRLQLWGAATYSPTGSLLQSHSLNWLDGSGHNNGNLWSVIDNINSDATQNFTYDNLNRIKEAWTSGNFWGNTYQIDAWGNLNKMLAYGTKPPVAWFDQMSDANNRLIGWAYDAAGNLLLNGSTSYQYDAENRIKTVNSGSGATYTYDADGNRVRKDSTDGSTEYLYFGGQVIAERNVANGDWTDYIYANGKRIAKSEPAQNQVRFAGTNPGSSEAIGWESNRWPTSGDDAFIVRTGDKLVFSEVSTQPHAGMFLYFINGQGQEDSVLSLPDSNGCQSTEFCTSGWTQRVIALDSLVNLPITHLDFYATPNVAGPWETRYKDVALVRADGTVKPIFNGGTSLPGWYVWNYSTATATIQRIAEDPTSSAVTTTTYYHDDHLGTSRLMTSSFGYPIWQGTFLPYGQEWNPQTTTNHYKFTGKERDSETNLDYFGARYYGSTMGRFLSPDEFAGGPVDVFGGDPTPPGPLPYADITNPQSLNKYAYTYNNPLRYTDPDGHCVFGIDTIVCYGVALGAAMVATYAATPQGQQVIRNGVKAILDTPNVIRSLFGKDADVSPPPATAQPQSGTAPPVPFPGTDPTVPPGDGWVWKGKGTPQSGDGNWVNPTTGEQLHPDLGSKTHGPHWDYQKGRGKDAEKGRVYPDGRYEPKVKPKKPTKPPEPEKKQGTS